MKQYEFVHLNINWGLGSGSEEHRRIIADFAAAGWRYAGFIPTDITNYGRINAIDLVFEKDVKSPTT